MDAVWKTTNKDAVREHGCSEIDTENVTYYSVRGTYHQHFFALRLLFVYLSRTIFAAEPPNAF